MAHGHSEDLSAPRPIASGRVLPLYRRAFEILAGEIVRKDPQLGAHLHESQVAERFGISRAPARQALSLLEQAGLICRSGARGYEVRAELPLDHAALADLPAAGDQHLSSAASWEHIYGEVEGEIIARIAFGSWRVREAELARYHNVSRTVARDVMARLQQRGLVEKDERSHWVAPQLTPEHVHELYELRWTLEPLALVKAAPHIPAGLLKEVRGRLSAADAHPENVDGAILDELEQDLHIRLMQHCRNRALMQAITLPQSLLIAHKFLYRWTSRLFDTEPFLPEHLQVVDLLAAGKMNAAAKALEKHLRQSYDRAIHRVEVVTAQFEPDSLPYLQSLS